MGGHRAGEVAAHLATDAIVARIGRPPADTTDAHPFGIEPSLSENGNLLRTAVHLANRQVFEVAGRVEAYAGMGTTVVAALVADRHLAVAHVGDSRLYVLAGGRRRRLTAEDSWAAGLLAQD